MDGLGGMDCGVSLGLTALWMGCLWVWWINWDLCAQRFWGVSWHGVPGWAVAALGTLCMRKPGILVMALSASSTAPPILALLSIPMEFKMVSS